MDRNELARRIDHTVLGPTTTFADVERVLGEAESYGMNACIPPCYVGEAREAAPETPLVTVVGFPQGQHTTETKRREAMDVVERGADEIDVVANVGRLKAGEEDAVEGELEALVDAVDVPLKLIVEATLLTEAEKHTIASIAVDAGVDFLKTSTGFADGGATVADVDLLSAYLPVKASGGIGSWEEAEAMFEAGAERIGASSGVAIVEGFPGDGD